MDKEVKERFKQFIRNERWGTCVSCPRDSDGLAYPEFCIHTNRYDHKLELHELVSQYFIRKSRKEGE